MVLVWRVLAWVASAKEAVQALQYSGMESFLAVANTMF
jgi:hypothetical protein